MCVPGDTVAADRLSAWNASAVEQHNGTWDRANEVLIGLPGRTRAGSHRDVHPGPSSQAGKKRLPSFGS
jgi:hypothetical protein